MTWRSLFVPSLFLRCHKPNPPHAEPLPYLTVCLGYRTLLSTDYLCMGNRLAESRDASHHHGLFTVRTSNILREVNMPHLLNCNPTRSSASPGRCAYLPLPEIPFSTVQSTYHHCIGSAVNTCGHISASHFRVFGRSFRNAPSRSRPIIHVLPVFHLCKHSRRPAILSLHNGISSPP